MPKYFVCYFLLVIFFGNSVAQNLTAVSKPKNSSSQVAVEWAELTVQIMIKARQNTPTYGSTVCRYGYSINAALWRQFCLFGQYAPQPSAK